MKNRVHENNEIDVGIPPVLLGTLRDCARTTRFGLVDKGSPMKLQRLSMLRLVEPKNGGYVVTEEGWQYLSEHKRELMKL